jgi:hypothetical protein
VRSRCNLRMVKSPLKPRMLSSNSTTYSFSDFTETEYMRLLEAAKQTHSFCFFDDYSNIRNPVLWRHDVDISVHRAAWMAGAENKLSVKATYYFMLHSWSYNLLEKDIQRLITKISTLGHSIGLHFDPLFYNDCDNANALEFYLRREKLLLEDISGVEVRTFSYHNPTEVILSMNDDIYGGMINAYSQTIRAKFTYCSDSNGYWRHESIGNVIRNNPKKPLHILTHPEWWQKDIMSPMQRFKRSLDGRMNDTYQKTMDVLKSGGRNYVDWE